MFIHILHTYVYNHCRVKEAWMSALWAFLSMPAARTERVLALVQAPSDKPRESFALTMFNFKRSLSLYCR